MADGGQLCLDWFLETGEASGGVSAGGTEEAFAIGSRPLLLVLPGLTGASRVSKSCNFELRFRFNALQKPMIKFSTELDQLT